VAGLAGIYMTDKTASELDLRAYAMRLLSRREYAVRELHSKVRNKWRQQGDIDLLADQLVDALQLEGSLSDKRYVEAFVRSRRQRSQGPLKIRAELRQKQLPDTLIGQFLDPEEEHWVELASTWLARQDTGNLDFAGRAKFYRRLINRGFSHDQAIAALEKP